MPYRLRARFQPAVDAGGDLGSRDTLILDDQPDPDHAASGTLESFYFAKGAGLVSVDAVRRRACQLQSSRGHRPAAVAALRARLSTLLNVCGRRGVWQRHRSNRSLGEGLV